MERRMFRLYISTLTFRKISNKKKRTPTKYLLKLMKKRNNLFQKKNDQEILSLSFQTMLMNPSNIHPHKTLISLIPKKIVLKKSKICHRLEGWKVLNLRMPPFFQMIIMKKLKTCLESMSHFEKRENGHSQFKTI